MIHCGHVSSRFRWFLVSMWLVLYCCIGTWPKKHNTIIAILWILFHLLVQNIHISPNYCRTLVCSGCRWKHMQKTSSGRVPRKLRIPKKLRKTDFIFLTDLFCWFYHIRQWGMQFSFESHSSRMNSLILINGSYGCTLFVKS